MMNMSALKNTEAAEIETMALTMALEDIDAQEAGSGWGDAYPLDDDDDQDDQDDEDVLDSFEAMLTAGAADMDWSFYE